MNRILCLLSLSILSAPVFSDSKEFVGSWDCHMSSEYSEQDSLFIFNSDGSYKKESSMFGSMHVELGVWKVENKTLVLEREKYIKNSEEKDSFQRFEQSILSAKKSELKITNGKSTTICKNS